MRIIGWVPVFVGYHWVYTVSGWQSMALYQWAPVYDGRDMLTYLSRVAESLSSAANAIASLEV